MTEERNLMEDILINASKTSDIISETDDTDIRTKEIKNYDILVKDATEYQNKLDEMQFNYDKLEYEKEKLEFEKKKLKVETAVEVAGLALCAVELASAVDWAKTTLKATLEYGGVLGRDATDVLKRIRKTNFKNLLKKH